MGSSLINAGTRELFIYDDIGPSWAGMIGATAVNEALKELGPGDVNVRINSYGGSCDEALAMLEGMTRHPGEMRVSVDSIAASAASLFVAQFRATAAKHARVMIHNPWGITIGDANQMRKTAEILDLYRDSIVTVYRAAMDISDDDIRALMDAETWYSAEAARDAGLVDEVTDAEAVEAKKVAPDRFRHTPSDLIDTGKPPIHKPETPQRIAARLRHLQVVSRVRKHRWTA